MTRTTLVPAASAALLLMAGSPAAGCSGDDEATGTASSGTAGSGGSAGVGGAGVGGEGAQGGDGGGGGAPPAPYPDVGLDAAAGTIYYYVS